MFSGKNLFFMSRTDDVESDWIRNDARGTKCQQFELIKSSFLCKMLKMDYPQRWLYEEMVGTYPYA